jgi:DHA2 family multidrug resistance protein-like MFS transporter
VPDRIGATRRDATVPVTAREPTGRRHTLAVLSVMIAVTLVTLDISIAYTALPAMAADLRSSAAATVWVVNAYQLAMVAAVIPLAALGESIGHRRVHVAGLVVFVAASLACALAGSLPALIGARVLQGLGAAAVVSVTTALIRVIYPPRSLGRGLGLYAMVVAVAFAFGPTVASLVLSLVSWHWLYLLHLPLGALALVLGVRALPATEGSGHRYDVAAAMLSAGMFTLLVYGIGEAARSAPWPRVAATWAAALACCVLLLRRQAGHPAPMLAIDLLRRPLLSLSAATSVFSFVVQGLAFVSLPFLLHSVMRRSQMDTGLLMTTWPVVLGIMALNAGRLSDRWPAATLGGIGLMLLCAGMALLAALPREAAALDIAWRLALCGVGFGLFQAPNMNAIMGSAPAERSGGASGIVATSRMLGQALGAALAAACFAVSEESGPTTALWVGSGFAVLASVTSLLRHWAGGPEKASSTGDRGS